MFAATGLAISFLVRQVTLPVRKVALVLKTIAEGTSDINQAVASISVQGENNKVNVEKLATEASAFHVR